MIIPGRRSPESGLRPPIPALENCMTHHRKGITGRALQAFLAPLFILCLLLLPAREPSAGQESVQARGQVSEPGQDGRPLEVQDMVAIKRVGNPVVSPDGRWVAYTVGTSSLEAGESGTRIWMVSTSGGDPMPMTAEGYSASNPGWSPDGRYLSFVATRGDSAHAQVWVLDRRMGEGEQLTEEEWGIDGYEWSPDGSRISNSARSSRPCR